ncbi:MAG: hypothetical protein NZ555_02575 [Geminicoccaceae bacterium]|nr:hypothetical protein [Geminicoccaceae bacterium]
MVGSNDERALDERALDERPETSLLVVLTLAVLTFLFYFTFRPYEFSDNGIHYLESARRSTFANPGFYPPHLLHPPMIDMAWSLFSSIIPGCDLFCSAALYIGLWATIGIVATFLAARALLGSLPGALATAIGLGVAHGYWVYAGQPEVYVPTVGAMTSALALLLTAGPVLGTGRIVLAAIFWALACFFHLASVVLFIPFGILVLGRYGFGAWRKLLLLYVVAGGIVLTGFLGAYAWVGVRPLSPAGFLEWVLEITNRPLTDWGTTANLVSVGELARAAWSQVRALVLLPEMLTLPLPPPLDQAPIAVLVGSAIAATLLWNLVQLLRRADLAVPRATLLAMFALLFVFFIWWDTGVHKFFIPSSAPLVLLAAIALRDVASRFTDIGRRRLVGIVATVLAIMFLFNASSVLELTRSRGPGHAEAGVLARLGGEECRLWVDGTQMGPLMLYYDRQNVGFFTLLPRDFYLRAIGEAPASPPPFTGEPCAFVPIGWLTRANFEDVVRPYLPEGRWEDFIAYLLDARPTGDGSRITHHPLDIVRDEALTYALIDRGERVESEGIEAVTEAIERTARAELDAHWPASLHERWGPTLLAVPRTDVRVERDRRLIFGYGWGDIARRPVERADLRWFVQR